MYKKILLILVFCFSCLLSSCRATRQEIQKTETQTNVTAEKLVTYKDTIVFAPKAETDLKIPLSELVFNNALNSNSKPIIYTQKNGQAKVKLRIIHDTIQVFASCDSLALIAKIKYQFLKETSKINSDHNKEIKTKTGFSFWNLLIAFLLGFSICYVLKFFKLL